MPTQDRYEDTLARLDRFAVLTDSQFTIPFTRIKIGLDALIGLLPVVGDAAGLVLSAYVLIEALRLGVPRRLLGRMLFNVLLEFVVGIVPVLGDAFDVYWRANTRNTALLREHIGLQLEPPPPIKTDRGQLALAILVVAVTVLVAVLLLPVGL